MTDVTQKRRLAAIVMADVVGYTRLMGADEAGTFAALNRHRAAFIDPAITAYGGRLVKSTGDGLLLEFGSVVDATRFAMALQHGMAARNAAIDESKRIIYRIGVNIGDILVQGEDIFGDGVNVAARLETLSEPGGLCLSRAAYDQIRHALDIPCVDMGAHMVKNVARPIEVFALSAAALEAMPATGQTGMAGATPLRRRPAVVLALVLAAGCAAAIGVAGLAAGRHAPPPPLPDQLEAILAKGLPDTTSRARKRLVASYLALASHRAFALAPNARQRSWTGEWPSRDIAEEKVLERCQAAFAEPCVLLASDDAVTAPAADGLRPARDMPRPHYAGTFNPEFIPAIRASTLKRPDIAGYAGAPNPKAAAFQVHGLFHVSLHAASQHEAEEKALLACNSDLTHRDSEGPCYLYAVENRVVLPERRTEPLTPAPP